MGDEEEKEGTHAFIKSFYNGMFTENLLCAREQRCQEETHSPSLQRTYCSTLYPPHISEEESKSKA